jgi:hypothetical protein
MTPAEIEQAKRGLRNTGFWAVDTGGAALDTYVVVAPVSYGVSGALSRQSAEAAIGQTPLKPISDEFATRVKITQGFDFEMCVECGYVMNSKFGDPLVIVHNKTLPAPLFGPEGAPISATGYHVYSIDLSTGYAWDNFGFQGTATAYRQALLRANPNAVSAGSFRTYTEAEQYINPLRMSGFIDP